MEGAVYPKSDEALGVFHVGPKGRQKIGLDISSYSAESASCYCFRIVFASVYLP